LRALGTGRVLLAFDFDGTLAPVTERPERARMSTHMRRLLLEVAQLYPCAVISGRRHSDLRRRVRDVPLVALLGSHGAEGPDTVPSTEARQRVRTWAAWLRRRLRRHYGVVLEPKPHGLAVHYRLATDSKAANDAILEALAALQGIRWMRGKKVIEILPRRAPNKGHALTALRRQLKPRAILYIGDDVTDEDAFSSRGPGRLLPVRIGTSVGTRAHFRLDSQAEVEALLAELVRRAPGRSPVTTPPSR
jgi:trehalose 6-phosphate phosphatase